MTCRVSACIITFNEADRLGPCLESVAWADELLVVDSGSTDGTVEVARRHGARVVERPFSGHVEQKNFAVDQAREPWILSLDADERLSPELSDEIQRELAAPRAADAYSMPRRTWYLGRWIRHGGWYPDRKVRLFRKDRGRWSGRNPHDRVEVRGRVEALRGDILHYTYRDVSDHVRKLNAYTSTMALERHREGERFRPWRLVLGPPARFLRAYVWRLGFLDGLQGLSVASLAAFYVLLRQIKLFEIEHERSRHATRREEGGTGER